MGDPPTVRQDWSRTRRKAASDSATGLPFIDEADTEACAISACISARTPSAARSGSPAACAQSDADSPGPMRGVGEGAIELTGITGTVSAAYLYWHGPTSSNDPASNAQVVFGDTSITGTNIGTSGDNFWDAFNSQAYRADVTTLVTGNGSYALSGFLKERADINGASLIVFFDDGNAANNRDIVLLDGNDANWDNPNDLYGWTASLPGLRYIGGEASVTLHVSDGQDFPDGS